MKKYKQIYTLIKDMILSGELQPGDRIPSVRKAAVNYNVSLTTIQSAYFELCADGYIIAHSKSGYYVSNITHNRVAEGHLDVSSEIN